jgi:hypothetical protein
MTWTRDQALDEDGRIGEGALRLGLRALEGRRQLLLAGGHADAPPAAPGRGLDHDRIADRPGVLDGGFHRLHRAGAPGGHRHAGLLREHLGLNLVAQAAHDIGGRADEGDADAGAQLGEVGVLGDEAPADPGRVGPALAQRALELVMVEVGVRGPAAADDHGLVGLADEHGPPLGLGVEGDRPHRAAVLEVELAHRADQAHGSLAAIDDRHAGHRGVTSSTRSAIRAVNQSRGRVVRCR